MRAVVNTKKFFAVLLTGSTEKQKGACDKARSEECIWESANRAPTL